MELFGVFLLICGGPFLFFLIGWASCYLLIVKYRFHVERRLDQPPAGGRRQTTTAWEP
jgi:hypothetical protein